MGDGQQGSARQVSSPALPDEPGSDSVSGRAEIVVKPRFDHVGLR